MRKVNPKLLAKTPFPLPDVVTKVVPAPTEGWDAISPLAIMDPKRAVVLDNWVPRPGWVELRAGYTPWAWVGSDSDPVESLMVRRSLSGQQMFAAAGSSIYNVSNLGTATPVVTGLGSARWQYINFTPGLGTTVIQLCNGVDALQQWDGSSWTEPNITGLPGGRDSTSIININAQKQRIWYTLTDGGAQGSSVAAFMPTDAITGAIAGSLDLGALWSKGGYLVAIGNWTVDGGAGPQDYTVFLSSRGQVSIYAGTDPTSAANWSLVGTFDLSPPISRRCLQRVGSDLGLITQDGVIPISTSLPFDPSADRSVAITARIQNAMANAAAQSSSLFGWQFITFPAQQLAILNIPLVENSQQVQFVMNALTGAWCRFTGWNANVFEIYNNDMYFGDNMGGINLAYDGGLDLNQTIAADMQCAFNYFDDPGRVKRMTMVQPLMIASGNFTPTISVDEDFAISSAVAPVSILSGGALWDTAVWDVSEWPTLTQVVNPWLSVEAMGHALAVHMGVNITPQGSLIPQIAQFDIGVFDAAVFDASVSNLAPQLQVNAFNSIIEWAHRLMADVFTPEQLQFLQQLQRPAQPFTAYPAPATEQLDAATNPAPGGTDATALPAFASPQNDQARAQQQPLRPDGKPQPKAAALPTFKMPTPLPQVPYDVLAKMQVGKIDPGLQEAQMKMIKLLQQPSAGGKPVGGVPLPGTGTKLW